MDTALEGRPGQQSQKASVKRMKEPTFVKAWCVPGTASCVLNKISSYNLKAVAPKYEY